MMTPCPRADFDRALQALRAGGIVCLPTESSYGLAVDASSEAGLARLASLKGRDARAPFGLVAASREQAMAWTEAWPAAAARLAEEHWPGPLTLILPPRAGLSSLLLGPSGGVGLRISSHEVVRELAAALGNPVTATSANPSGSPAASSEEQARRYFGDEVDVYLDGGQCGAPASTLVDFDDEGRPLVLRQGPVVLGDRYSSSQ